MTPAREQWTSNGNAYEGHRQPEPRTAAVTRRDTEDMLARVTRSENESNDVYRRIEDQLRQVARRLESAERNQTENNRAMTKAASEINVAAREQAQAFDQLGGSVSGLAERLERVERTAANDGTRDAIKGLHQGLSRLADQISNTANQSATQISALATNLESLAGRLADARAEAEQATQSIDRRVDHIDQRLHQVASIGDSVEQIDYKVAQIDQRMSHVGALDERLRSVERGAQAANDVLTQTVQSLEARKDEEAAALRRDAETAGAIARLEDNFSQIENRAADPGMDRRLSSIERSLTDIVTRFDTPAAHTDAIEDNLKRLAQRIEANESRQRDQVAELRAAIDRPAPPPANPFAVAAEPPHAIAAAPSPFAPPAHSFEAPPFAESPAEHGFAASADPFAAATTFDAAEPPFADQHGFSNAFNTDPFASEPPPVVADGDNYLTAARRSARAAAAQADTERDTRTGRFSWGTAAATTADEAPQGKKTYVWIGIIAAVIVVAILAGALLSHKLSTNSSTHSVSMLFPKAVATRPSTEAADVTAPGSDVPPPVATKPLPAPRIVTTSPVHVVPPKVLPQAPATAPANMATAAATPDANALPTATTAPKPAAAPLDKLTQLANAGNSKAELVVGLKYLDGDGVTVDEANAAKWLERAAEAGQPVAQYRLGTMYERGRGMTADATKAVHWYEIAAQAGNRKAMHNLAVALASGTGTTKNLAEAARWFSKAAALGLSDSEFNLAVLYERGMGVPQSLLDAYKWYAIAAAAGDTESKARIDALSTQLSADDRAAAQHAAESFHAAPIDPKSNVAPQMGDVAG